jgi:amidase
MDLTALSATRLAAMIRAGHTRPSEVVAAHLERIAEANPALNALVSLRAVGEVMAEARALDDAPPRGALHGLPVAVKDLVATAGLRTTWGSPLYATHVPARDDLVAARMRAAGAVFLGKSNVPEWGQGSHSFNPVFGATGNPYAPARSAGGSSGGAAAALAARMVPLADGSDMMGSLRNPAAFCNVYGFRPTWGLVPQDAEGDTFLATLSTEGPMARTVEDLALLLGVLAGENPGTPFPRPVEDWAAALPGASLRGVRIGWAGDWGGAYATEPGILALCEAALAEMEGMGAIVTPLPPPYPAERLWQAWTTLRAMLSAGARGALWRDPAKRAALKPEAVWEIEQGLHLTAAEVHAASVIRSRWYARAAEVFRGVDLIALPSAQVWPFPIGWRWPERIGARAMDTYHRWMEVVVPASLAGLPALSVPVGFGAAPDGTAGLPMGMQLIGPAGADARVLAAGEAWHRATDWPGRRPPPGVAAA